MTWWSPGNTFMAAIDAFQAARVEMVPISVDKDGLVPEALERACVARRQGGLRPIKALYTIPVAQNPCGTRLTLERYQAIYGICLQHGVVIVEDDPYFYLQHNADICDDDHQRHVSGTSKLGPSFLSVDSAGIVLRLDSFSKIFAPGFRIGWVTGAVPFIRAIEKVSFVSSQHGCSLSMVCLSALLQELGESGFDEQIVQLQVLLRQQCRALLRAMDKHLQGIATWTTPSAGMFVWIRLTRIRPGTNNQDLLTAMAKHGVIPMPGYLFQLNRDRFSPYLRLSCVLPEEAYDDAIRRLWQVLNDLSQS